MGDRTVPFDEDEKCDECGKVGAFDFMGDLLCGDCAHEALRPRTVEEHCEEIINELHSS